ncbi:MAG: hypothetical protein HQ582_06115 [Planctomycetes bacterium]|nr:hypothetical protein [Planctomycetota bacterium]
MPPEPCYRCGKTLDGYFRMLCDECREVLDDNAAAENAKEQTERKKTPPAPDFHDAPLKPNGLRAHPDRDAGKLW